MTEVPEPAPHSRSRAILTVVAGTIVFFVIVGLVGSLLRHALHDRFSGSLRARVTVGITGAMLGEIALLLLLVFYLRTRGRSLRDLGLWRPSSLRGWILAAVFTLLYLWMTFTAVLRGHTRLSEVSFFHLYNALTAGIVAGFVEEIFFRGFVMSELSWAGFGATVQVLAGGILFGVAHSGWGLFSGRVNWPALIGAVTATTVVGLAYAIAYLAGRRSLMPVIAGHLVMDLLLEPWLLMTALRGAMGRPH